MKLRKAIKRIVAIGAGVSMLGATMFGAMAQSYTLDDYPAPFITQDGVFDGLVVVGTGGSDPAGLATDIIGVTSIVASLQASSTSPAGSGVSTGSDVTVSGVSWKVGTSSRKLELSEDKTTDNIEEVRDIVTRIESSDFGILADGIVDSNKYKQYLNFGANGANEMYAMFTDDNDRDENDVQDYFVVKDGKMIAEYELELSDVWESDRFSSTGSETSAAQNLDDLEDEVITMLGKEFTVVKAQTSTTSGDNSGVELTLMGGAQLDTLEEGATREYTINGVPYKVTVLAITDTAPIQAKFQINGEVTKSMQDGESKTLNDGTEIGVTDIVPNEAGDVTNDLVQFYVGAQKVMLKDTNISVAGTGEQEVEVNNNDIDEATVTISGTSTSSKVSLENIKINMTADDDFYIAPGEKLSEHVADPEVLFTQNWDIAYYGLSSADTEEIKIAPNGDDVMELRFADGNGNEVSAPIAYTASGSTFVIGDDSNNKTLVLNESWIIKEKDYLIVTDSNQDDGERSTYVLEYTGSDQYQADEISEYKFKDRGSGETLTATMSSAGAATLRAYGAEFTIANKSEVSAKDVPITMDLDGSGATGSNVVAINTNNGAKIAFGGVTNNANGTLDAFQDPGVSQTTSYGSTGSRIGLTLTVTTPDSDDYDNLAPGTLQYNITATAAEFDISQGAADTFNYQTPDAEENVQYTMNSMGAYVDWKTPSGDPDTVTIDYPSQQRLPQVYFIGEGVSTSSSAGAGSENVNVNPIEVNSFVLDTEVADITAQNAIIVGGTCVNRAAAAVAGVSPGTCGAEAGTALGLPANKAVINLYQNDDNVAVLVAGYAAEDTRRAAVVLSKYNEYDLTGDQVVVSGTTLNDITIGAPEMVDDGADDMSGSDDNSTTTE